MASALQWSFGQPASSWMYILRTSADIIACNLRVGQGILRTSAENKDFVFAVPHKDAAEAYDTFLEQKIGPILIAYAIPPAPQPQQHSSTTTTSVVSRLPVVASATAASAKPTKSFFERFFIMQ